MCLWNWSGSSNISKRFAKSICVEVRAEIAAESKVESETEFDFDFEFESRLRFNRSYRCASAGGWQWQ